MKKRRDGTTVYYSLVDKKIGQACNLVHDILIAQIKKNKEMAEELVA